LFRGIQGVKARATGYPTLKSDERRQKIAEAQRKKAWKQRKSVR
jgi:hypothetical protein